MKNYPIRILYVEDDPQDADLARRSLEKASPQFNLDTVNTFHGAVKKLAERSDYDLVLTDLKLPDGSGLSLLTHIRSHGLHCAVVIISGRGDEETAVAALKSGADDYLVKNQNYLITLPITLENIVKRHSKNLDLKSRPLRVLYGEHHAADIDLTMRHMAQYAPFIQMEILTTPIEIKQRLLNVKNRDTFDVVLLDFSLPGLNIFETLQEFIRVHRFEIPVILVTGQGSEDTAVQVLKLGAADYIVKNPGYLFYLPGLIENAYYRTKLLREQEILREREAELSSLISSAMDAIITVGENQLITSFNPAAEQLFRCSKEEVLEKPVDQLIPDEVRRNHWEHISKFGKEAESKRKMQTGTIARTCKRADGTTFPSEISISYYTVGEKKYYTAFIRDITERVEASEKLAASEAELRALFASMHDLVLVIDRNGVYKKIAPTNPSLLYRPAEELLGLSLKDVFQPELADSFLKTVRNVLKNQQTSQIEYELPVGDNVLWFSTFISPLDEEKTV